jgi:hypothetical protein
VFIWEFMRPFFSKPSTDYQANFIVEQSPANRKRDFRPTSANRILRALFATPSIELKNQLGDRKKTQKPVESLSGNTGRLFNGQLFFGHVVWIILCGDRTQDTGV